MFQKMSSRKIGRKSQEVSEDKEDGNAWIAVLILKSIRTCYMCITGIMQNLIAARRIWKLSVLNAILKNQVIRICMCQKIKWN